MTDLQCICLRYRAIVKYKTAFYSFYLPVAAAMYMVSFSYMCFVYILWKELYIYFLLITGRDWEWDWTQQCQNNFTWDGRVLSDTGISIKQHFWSLVSSMVSDQIAISRSIHNMFVVDRMTTWIAMVILQWLERSAQIYRTTNAAGWWWPHWASWHLNKGQN